jgi:hypothetical protein
MWRMPTAANMLSHRSSPLWSAPLVLLLSLLLPIVSVTVTWLVHSHLRNQLRALHLFEWHNVIEVAIKREIVCKQLDTHLLQERAALEHVIQLALWQLHHALGKHGALFVGERDALQSTCARRHAQPTCR